MFGRQAVAQPRGVQTQEANFRFDCSSELWAPPCTNLLARIRSFQNWTWKESCFCPSCRHFAVGFELAYVFLYLAFNIFLAFFLAGILSGASSGRHSIWRVFCHSFWRISDIFRVKSGWHPRFFSNITSFEISTSRPAIPGLGHWAFCQTPAIL